MPFCSRELLLCSVLPLLSPAALAGPTPVGTRHSASQEWGSAFLVLEAGMELAVVGKDRADQNLDQNKDLSLAMIICLFLGEGFYDLFSQSFPVLCLSRASIFQESQG